MKLLHNSMHIKCMGLNGRLTIQTRLDELNSLSLVRLMKS